MSIPGSVNPLFLGAAGQDDGYSISRSLRFNSADSAYLSRTPASAGNRKTWTWAGWVKQSKIGDWNVLFQGSAGNPTANLDDGVVLRFFSGSSTLNFYQIVNGVTEIQLNTQAAFRDPSAWYHIVVQVDTTQATPSNRVKIYINGVEVVFFTVTYPTQDLLTYANTTNLHTIGALVRDAGPPQDFHNGYLADIHFIDGQALDPTSFGEFDEDTGVWVPKRYTGTYGTNGFQLKFADNSNNTATTLGKDTSPNGNNWTPNNLSITAGAGNDSLIDVPTNGAQTDTGAGGEVRGNYATLNPLSAMANAILANGNLDWSATQTTSFLAQSTIAMSSGKWYCEFTSTTSNNIVGLQRAAGTPSTAYVGGNADSWGYFALNGNKYNNNTAITYGATYTSGDVVGIAFDADNGTLTFYKNGVSQGQAYSGLTNGPYTFAVGNGTNQSGVFNFGQRPFAYTAPSGFKALNTANLPAPTITNPSTVMDVKLYTGNGSTQTISGLGFSPDFVWGKVRNGGGGNHMLADIVRGATKRLISNATSAEDTGSALVSFDSSGFSLDSASAINQNTDQVVAWTWDAGSSTVTNTQGSITSSVRANATAGFSIVTYTANGTNGTSVGHGLGVKPALVIQKDRTSASDWLVLTQLIDGSNDYLLLNSTAAAATAAAGMTSTTFGSWDRTNGNSMVAYCFAPVAGYSSFGSYTGNGSADGPFVYTNGFRPRLVMVKSSSAVGNWNIQDAVRNSVNPSNSILLPNASDAEQSNAAWNVDFVSNGFKIRTTDGLWNGNGTTYIYAAFSEVAFNFARAR